jgi:hypothetical protein
MVSYNTTLFYLPAIQKNFEKRFPVTENVPKMADAYVE